LEKYLGQLLGCPRGPDGLLAVGKKVNFGKRCKQVAKSNIEKILFFRKLEESPVRHFSVSLE